MEKNQYSFIADVHVHSKYSMDTSPLMDLEGIYAGAQIKGISVIGTGDFTHPAWFAEIQKKLEPAEEGLFKLKKKYQENRLRKHLEKCAQVYSCHAAKNFFIGLRSELYIK